MLGLGAAPWCLPQGICCALGYKGRVTGEDERLPILWGCLGLPASPSCRPQLYFTPGSFGGGNDSEGEEPNPP